jgi:hypothetical protein
MSIDINLPNQYHAGVQSSVPCNRSYCEKTLSASVLLFIQSFSHDSHILCYQSNSSGSPLSGVVSTKGYVVMRLFQRTVLIVDRTIP